MFLSKCFSSQEHTGNLWLPLFMSFLSRQDRKKVVKHTWNNNSIDIELIEKNNIHTEFDLPGHERYAMSSYRRQLALHHYGGASFPTWQEKEYHDAINVESDEEIASVNSNVENNGNSDEVITGNNTDDIVLGEYCLVNLLFIFNFYL